MEQEKAPRFNRNASTGTGKKEEAKITTEVAGTRPSRGVGQLATSRADSYQNRLAYLGVGMEGGSALGGVGFSG